MWLHLYPLGHIRLIVGKLDLVQGEHSAQSLLVLLKMLRRLDRAEAKSARIECLIHDCLRAPSRHLELATAPWLLARAIRGRLLHV